MVRLNGRNVAAAATLVVALGYLILVSDRAMEAMWFVWDDSFISYIYSSNLAHGFGLRFNPTDPAPTSGFSSLGHVLLVAGANRLGIDSLLATRWVSLLLFLLMPAVLALPVASLLKTPRTAALTLFYTAQILLFLTTSTAYHLQLGMETMLFMFSLACLTGWSVMELNPENALPRMRLPRILFGAFAAAMTVILRPEGPVMVLCTLALIWIARRFLLPGLRQLNDAAFFTAVTAGCIFIVLFISWHRIYFGYFLPNPYYVKSHNAIFGSRGVLLPGLPDTLDFFRLILPWLIGGTGLIFLTRAERTGLRTLLVAGVPGLLMVLAYSRAIHEAAWFHRYELPFLVYLLLPLCGMALIVSRRLPWVPVLLVPAAIVAVHLVFTSRVSPPPGAVPWRRLNLGQISGSWISMGQDLGRTGLGQQATIALTAAGAIPFYSGFRTIDLIGLNDNFLSGRTPHSLDEVWEYIEHNRPDVFYSGLPPASPGVPVDAFDPVLKSPVLRAQEGPNPGSELVKHWDQDLFRGMLRREMAYIRDHYTFGGAYKVGKSVFIMLYVRTDSPQRERILRDLQNSNDVDRWTNLTPLFFNDPRRL